MSDDDDGPDMEKVSAWLAGYCAGFESGILHTATMLQNADGGPFSVQTKKTLKRIGEKLALLAETLTKKEMEERIAEVEADANQVRH